MLIVSAAFRISRARRGRHFCWLDAVRPPKDDMRCWNVDRHARAVDRGCRVPHAGHLLVVRDGLSIRAHAIMPPRFEACTAS